MIHSDILFWTKGQVGGTGGSHQDDHRPAEGQAECQGARGPGKLR